MSAPHVPVIDEVIDRLGRVRWSSALAWDPQAIAWLRTYYQRLLPFWPSDRARIEPADPVIEAAVMAPRSEAERARIATACQALFGAARERGERIEATTRKLVPLVLGWAMAIDAGTLERARDPGAPLCALYRAGFQLAYSHAGIELHHATGWQIAPVPARASL